MGWELVVEPLDVSDRGLMDEVIELGNVARPTLGHLPYAAYDAAADNRTLLVARANGVVVGYALYGLVRRRIRLTHLCVAPGARGQGVARSLMDGIRERHADYLGVRARCRRDYDLAPMWLRLGFEQQGERPGRGKDRADLTDWWLDYGHSDLYTGDTGSVLVRAAIDMNILRNWIETGRPGHEESLSLLADHLEDRLQLFRTPGLDAEIEMLNGPLRGQCLRKVQSLARAPRDPDRALEISAQLLADAVTRFPKYPETRQDEFDLQHVSTALAGGLNVFVTMDSNLSKALGPAAERQGMRVLRPADVVVRIDELERAEAYRPIDLQNSRYSRRLLASGEDQVVSSLANTTAGERPKNLITAARRLAVEGGERTVVFGPRNDLVAYYGLRQKGAVLEVETLRLTDGHIRETLTRQLLFDLRLIARERAANVLLLNSTHLQTSVRNAAIEDGFLAHEEFLAAFVIDAIGDAASIEHAVVRAAHAAGLARPRSLRPSMIATSAAELEQFWWPAKVTDAELTTYLVPIRQAFSSELLGIPVGLWRRDDDLGLSREHVYYRRPGKQKLESPARILWYISQGGNSVAQSAAIVACSQLDAVHIGPPDELHSRFQHLGVWNLATVTEAATHGQVQALRFTNTEIFGRDISLPRYRKLAEALGLSGAPPQSPKRIVSDLFAAIYHEGMAR
ncbi:acetyltransferase (GNAT) family protein [Kribbella rubisoli]|uniref:Acetyltransferase (GNAT) family protein n=1 Tax=Kribbella rubisoli TaxID=3075929 RepID=A0A4Q7X1Y7_9ACTN|nr:acetyltransferase (GNAT) family protein [Kribbella rubisoli]